MTLDRRAIRYRRGRRSYPYLELAATACRRLRLPYTRRCCRWRRPDREGVAGENACTVHQFRQMMTVGAVSYAQPSVTKVGGVTEYLKVVALADERGVKLAPPSPYFGPGF